MFVQRTGTLIFTKIAYIWRFVDFVAGVRLEIRTNGNGFSAMTFLAIKSTVTLVKTGTFEFGTSQVAVFIMFAKAALITVLD